MRPCVENVTFTAYEQSEPNQVVFLIGGSGTTDEWWFKDLTILDDYKDTLFIGVGQSYTLEKDIGIIIDWVKSNYDFPDKWQWSFFGFSLGAYITFNTALDCYYDVFDNYGAVGGGIETKLEENPHFRFMYIAYGSWDIDKSSALWSFNCLKEKKFLTAGNYRIHEIEKMSHCLEEAQIGLNCFLIELRNRNFINLIKWRK